MRRWNSCTGGRKRRSVSAEELQACPLQTAPKVAEVVAGVEEVGEEGVRSPMVVVAEEVAGGVLRGRKAKRRLPPPLEHNYGSVLGLVLGFPGGTYSIARTPNHHCIDVYHCIA